MSSKAEHYIALVKRIEKGDAEAENELISILESRIKYIVRYNVNNQHDHNDLVNDAVILILKALRKGKYDPSKATVPTYIGTITMNTIRDYWRGQKRIRDRFESLPADEPPDCHAQGSNIDPELVQVLRKNLAKLPPTNRSVLELIAEGYKAQEIAEKLGFEKRQKVYDLVAYSIERLKKMMK